MHVTKHNDNQKMAGFVSLNTSMHNNKYCQKMSQNKDLICSRCYAHRFEAMFPNLRNTLAKNSELLSNRELTSNEIYATGFSMRKAVRFNSFGELINKKHYKNLVKIAEHFPDTIFTLWTKRSNLVRGIDKPDNLILVFSSPKINVVSKLPYGFDKVFTVFDKDYIEQNSIDINCVKQCNTCMKCYKHNDITFINEAIK